MKSVNHPWAVSDKFRSRYGDVWANIDFVFQEKISEDNFRTDPMNTKIGYLSVSNQNIDMLYKDIIAYAKTTKTLSDESYVTGTKNDSYEVRIKSQTFTLQRHELAKLSDTLNEASASTVRAYELGLYL
jgi:hypothetical protein